MKISLEDLGKITNNLLCLLDREGIYTTEDLETILNKTFNIEKSQDTVSIKPTNSNYWTTANTIIYYSPKVGIPLEIKINKEQKYSSILVKSKERLQEYAFRRFDEDKNIVHRKILKTTDFSVVKKELERLKKDLQKSLSKNEFY